MKAMVLHSPIRLDRLIFKDRPDPGAPSAGEIRVALHGSSLNFHDLGVVTGKIPSAVGRIPLADGSGVVEAVGTGVTELEPGDHVVSCFFPDWQDGAPTIGEFSRTPGDGIDGFACEHVVLPATAFTAPVGYDAVEAATITTAGLTAWRRLWWMAGSSRATPCCSLEPAAYQSGRFKSRSRWATVAITSSSDEKLGRATDIGADLRMNYREREDWGRTVRDWTGGRGVEHVVEVGGPATLPQSIEAVRVGGSHFADRRAHRSRR